MRHGIALLIVCSWLTLPMTVSFTTHTFCGLFIVFYFIRRKKSLLVISAYLLLGLIGFPVFADFGGGIAVLLGLTGGYLAGFWFSALMMWGREQLWRQCFGLFLLCAVLSLLLCYT